MPRKIRELIGDLQRAGFTNRGGKGSHRNFTHPSGAHVTLSGREGDDARHYQEKQVRREIARSQGEETMKTRKKITAKDYLKIVEWSDEDHCFIGSAPPLIGQCCHGNDEATVIRQLGRIVEEWMAIHEKDGRPLPEPTAGQEYSGKFVLRIPPELHKILALRALSDGVSLNAYCARQLGVMRKQRAEAARRLAKLGGTVPGLKAPAHRRSHAAR